MSTAFVPLFPQVAAKSEIQTDLTRLKVRTLESGTSASVSAFAPKPKPGMEVTASCALTHADKTPQISLQRDGDKVVGIRIECSCGQVIQLDCLY